MQGIHRGAGAVRIAALLFTAALVASACLGTMTPAPTVSPAASASAADTAGTSARPSSAATPPATSPGPLRIDLHKIAGGFDQPDFATDAGDGSGRLFVVEQSGQIRVVRDGTVLPSPFLDLSGKVSCCGERGLLGLALAPGFGQTSDTFFVDYTDQNGDTVIGRGSVARNGAADVANADVQVLLKIDQPFPNHNGGMLAFGPDGDLYIGMGDGGSGGDPQGNGQRLDTLLGKILRIDPLHGSTTADYWCPTRTRSSARPAPGPRSGRTGRGTLGASASTGRQATCGSAMSARTAGRRSMSTGPWMAAGAVSTMAGTGWKALTVSTRSWAATRRA